MRRFAGVGSLLPLYLLSTLPVRVLGSNVLYSDGYTTCMQNSAVTVSTLDVQYNRNTREITFDVAGSSTISQNVTISLTVTAYGKQVYSTSYNPCDSNIAQLCPLPATSFAAHGSEVVPSQYASQIPSIAFSVPDLDGTVHMELLSAQGQDIACLQASVTNGNSFSVSAVKYAAAGVAAGALAASLAGAASTSVVGGSLSAAGPSPSFVEVMGWFQGLAMNGMLSVQYPKVYQSFTTNFGFSTGLFSWASMQNGIDNFRKATGGNLTDNNYDYLKNNATLVFGQSGTNSSLTRRALSTALLWARDGAQVDVNGTSSSVGDGAAGANGGATNTTSTSTSKDQHFVSGIEAYVEQLSIPQANTFMTVLLVWSIVVAAIVVGILLIKLVLELVSQFGHLPNSLESWRKRYWWRLAKTLTNLILVLYGTWTLYCVYQFTDGDSWAAKLLAAVTLAVFTAVLAGFTYMIYLKAHAFKKMEGDTSRLYEDKEVWIKYSLFYDNYKRDYWWLFVPAIVYMFARGAVIAGANGHGIVQAAGQMIVEGLMLLLLIWYRPYQRPSGQWINITIQVVRILSVICILVFVEELGISQTTKTITGVVLIVVQSVLTGLLAILVAVNALITMIRENPHRRKRKEAEKFNREIDNLTPLDARNSLLMESMVEKGEKSDVVIYSQPNAAYSVHGEATDRYDPAPPSYRPTKAEKNSKPSLNKLNVNVYTEETLATSPVASGMLDDDEVPWRSPLSFRSKKSIRAAKSPKAKGERPDIHIFTEPLVATSPAVSDVLDQHDNVPWRSPLSAKPKRSKSAKSDVHIYTEPSIAESPIVSAILDERNDVPWRSPIAKASSTTRRPSRFDRDDEHEHLISSAASFAHQRSGSTGAYSHSPPRAPSSTREPKLPNVEFGQAM